MLLTPQIKRQLLFLALRGILALAIATGFVIFFSKQIDSINASIRSKQIILSQISQQEARFAKLQKDYDDVVLATYLLDAAFPSSEDPTPFKRRLEDLAKDTENEANVGIAAEFASPSELEGINVIPYNISLTGNLESFFNFLTQIQRISNFVIVKSMEISGEDIENKATMNLRTEVYVR